MKKCITSLIFSLTTLFALPTSLPAQTVQQRYYNQMRQAYYQQQLSLQNQYYWQQLQTQQALYNQALLAEQLRYWQRFQYNYGVNPYWYTNPLYNPYYRRYCR